jgi:hypothetical protein
LLKAVAPTTVNLDRNAIEIQFLKMDDDIHNLLRICNTEPSECGAPQLPDDLEDGRCPHGSNVDLRTKRFRGHLSIGLSFFAFFNLNIESCNIQAICNRFMSKNMLIVPFLDVANKVATKANIMPVCESTV